MKLGRLAIVNSPIKMPSPNPPEVIVYSGSFDPPHQGHIDCVDLVHARFPSALILIVPGLKPAGTMGHHKAPKASFADRLELCRSEFGKAATAYNLEVSELESTLATPNFTIRTLTAIAAKYHGRRLALLLGQDQWRQFPNWHEPLSILQLAAIVIVARQTRGEKLVAPQESVKDVVAKLRLSGTWTDDQKTFMLSQPAQAVYLVDGETCQAESRLLREHLAAGEPLPKRWLPETALDYIKNNGLYQAKGKK